MMQLWKNNIKRREGKQNGNRLVSERRAFNLRAGGKRVPRRHPWRYRKSLSRSYVATLKTNAAQMARRLRRKGTFRHLSPSTFTRKRWNKYPFDPSGTIRHLKGGSKEAQEAYPRMYWKDNPVRATMAFDYMSYPVDVVVLKREKAIKFHADDPDWAKVPNKWPIINRGTVVVFEETGGYSIAGLYLTSKEVPALEHLYKVSVKPCLASARTNLPPRQTFAVQGATRDLKYIDGKRKRSQHEAKLKGGKRRDFVAPNKYGTKFYKKMMRGMIWNDGFGGYMSLTKGWRGKSWYDYFKRNPQINDKDAYDFARFYVELYEVEKQIVPPIAKYRRLLAGGVKLPSIFPGVPRNMCPVTMAGISYGFGNSTHNDSCVNGITETICWCNRNLKGDNGTPLMFACTTARLAYDIGTRPVVLFQKGNEMHGTCVTNATHKSRGMVLISKRRTLRGKQRFIRNDVTDLRVSSTLRKKGSKIMMEDDLIKKLNG